MRLSTRAVPRLLAFALAASACILSIHAATARVSPAERRLAEGDGLFDRGLFEEAVARWGEAGKSFGKARNSDGELSALLREAAAYHALGLHRLAVGALDRAQEIATRTKNPHREAEIQAARGALFIFGREADKAEPLLRASLKTARAQQDGALVAMTLNDLGILLAAQGKYPEARPVFEEAIKSARRAGKAPLAAKARRNLADAALAAGEFADAEKWAEAAATAAAALPDGHGAAFLLMGAAQVLHQVCLYAPEHKDALRLRALRLHQQAADIAERVGDERGLSYALGYQGALYEFEKKHAEALRLTLRALFLAQTVRAPDALSRWQWQAGRLLAKQGERDLAIDSYRTAIETLKTIRNDIAIRHGNNNARSSFREAVGAIYFELADLLLQRADGEKDANQVQALLREARDTAELLKAAELDDYFQDDCVNLLKAKTKRVENLSRTAAVIYLIPLPDRTELLVSLAPDAPAAANLPLDQQPVGRLVRLKAGVGDAELTEAVRRLRVNLETRTTNEFMEQAQQLYAWLIKPLEPLMQERKLDTMVFIPGGALRTVPMAALHDGEHFLIEKYAVAVTPGLELMEASKIERSAAAAANASGVAPSQVMISALSDGVQGFPPLANVPEEVATIEKLYNQSGALMNTTFRRDSLAERLTKEEFSIVHIASHGHFDSDVRKSFVLTFDKQLTLDDLERYIRPAQLRDRPIELLTLSACQTAAGDDRAALGLAGVAVKAGARCAFATLWFVNDKASTRLVSDFYTELKTHPERSKAQALQVAQKKLLADERYQHPCYWAPYLIIGNWL